MNSLTFQCTQIQMFIFLIKLYLTDYLTVERQWIKNSAIKIY